MSNGVRLAALFACALTLVETGRRLAKKESLSRFGEVLLAGGMAFTYYCTFAAHHVGRLRVIESPAFGAVLLSVAALSIAAVSWLRQAKATAILGIVLASYATMLQPIGWMSCFSNLLLGGLGLFFMLRPGWSAPGWASMLGTYGAFLGWQLFGASGESVRTDDPATLWFLPPVWVMFAIPGAMDRFRESLSERARAWFTALNNALFFLLFSGVWLYQNGDDDYWKVAAVFGTVLIALGILGRRQNATAGGVNISQGIAVATLALILKLDGQNLALVLAFESLALAIASWKFRGKSEAVFSLLTGLGSTVLIIHHSANDVFFRRDELFPIWSISLTALLLLSSSRMATRIENPLPNFNRFLRASAAILFACAAIIATHLCLDRLDEAPALLTAIILALTLSIAFVRFDAERKQTDLLVGALWFLVLSVVIGFKLETVWPLVITTLVSLATCWLWHRSEGNKSPAPRGSILPAWAFSIATPVFAAMTVAAHRGTYAEMLILDELAAMVLAAIAIAIRCKRLLTTASAMALLSLILAIRIHDNDQILFLVTLIALIPAALIHLPWSRKRISEDHRFNSAWLFRTAAFIAYCAAWHSFAPGSWTDWLAITSIALTAVSVVMKRKMFVECLGLIGIALAGLSMEMLTAPWVQIQAAGTWRGILVIAALLALTLTYRQRPALIEDDGKRKSAIAALAGLTCLVTTVWATQMLIWRFGWKPTAVLWTLLGFAFVSAGLWQRLHILRVSGFLLLIISFCKLFAVDVWDFTTFMRVTSFIVLGAALILLGLFYNKFAETIKALLDDERGMKSEGK
jgi:hypothetical protein